MYSTAKGTVPVAKPAKNKFKGGGAKIPVRTAASATGAVRSKTGRGLRRIVRQVLRVASRWDQRPALRDMDYSIGLQGPMLKDHTWGIQGGWL